MLLLRVNFFTCIFFFFFFFVSYLYFYRGKPSYYGEYPLGFACGTGQWDIVEILLKYGADMDIVSEEFEFSCEEILID
jgi:hypothetical protein